MPIIVLPQQLTFKSTVTNWFLGMINYSMIIMVGIIGNINAETEVNKPNTLSFSTLGRQISIIHTPCGCMKITLMAMDKKGRNGAISLHT